MSLVDTTSTFKNILKKNPQSVIITSGTLTPINSFETELGVPFSIKHQGGHVIDKENVCLNLLY